MATCLFVTVIQQWFKQARLTDLQIDLLVGADRKFLLTKALLAFFSNEEFSNHCASVFVGSLGSNLV